MDDRECENIRDDVIQVCAAVDGQCSVVATLGAVVDGKERPCVWWLLTRRAPRVYPFDGNNGGGFCVDILADNNITPPRVVYVIVDCDGLAAPTIVVTLTVDSVPAVVGDCRLFEYWRSPPDFSRLVCENDHGEMLVWHESPQVS